MSLSSSAPVTLRAPVSVPPWASSRHSAPGRRGVLLSGGTRCVRPGGWVPWRSEFPQPVLPCSPDKEGNAFAFLDLAASLWPRPGRAVAHWGHPACSRGALLHVGRWVEGTGPQPQAPRRPLLAPVSEKRPSRACVPISPETSAGFRKDGPQKLSPAAQECGLAFWGCRRVGFWELEVKPKTGLSSQQSWNL